MHIASVTEHKHIFVKVLHSVDCYVNMTLYNTRTASIKYSTARIMFYRSSVLEQTFLCPTPHYFYEFKVSKNDFAKKKPQ